MPSNWPIVITPVPPTPATTMPHGASAGDNTGSGTASSEGSGRAALFFLLFIWPPSTVTKLGQKPFTQE